MKTEDALKELRASIEGCGFQCHIETYRAAIEALEKQIPSKPEPEKRFYGNGKCPHCGVVFKDKSTRYCGNCGQKLDWSDKE